MNTNNNLKSNTLKKVVLVVNLEMELLTTDRNKNTRKKNFIQTRNQRIFHKS